MGLVLLCLAGANLSFDGWAMHGGMVSTQATAVGGEKVPPLQWRHNGRECVSNHQPHDCLLNRLFNRRSKKTSKLRVTGLCMGNSPVTGEFPAQKASNAEHFSIWWRHHVWLLISKGLGFETIHHQNLTTHKQKCAYMCTFLLQSGALWDIGLEHCGICETDLLTFTCNPHQDDSCYWGHTHAAYHPIFCQKILLMKLSGIDELLK